MHWYDVAGSLGVAMIVCAYLFLQLGRVASDSLRYLLANALGAGLILISLSVEFNFSAFLIEAFWLALRVVAKDIRAMTRRPACTPAHRFHPHLNHWVVPTEFLRRLSQRSLAFSLDFPPGLQ